VIPSDLALAKSLMAGESSAFEPFVERFGPLVLSFGRQMCGHREDAEEVMQETLLKAYLSLKDLREPAALKTWVYRVAANACLRMRRGDKNDPRREISLDQVMPRPGHDDGQPEIPDWSNLPLEQFLRGELRSKLDQAILDLPKHYRIVLLLRDLEGFDTRETAQILGISNSLAKVRLHRARLALRKAIDGYLTGNSDSE
jgi:RNA polymerase sigma-70 factor (ECF subfamily)